MILSSERNNGPGGSLIYNLKDSLLFIRPGQREYAPIVLFCAAVIVFAGVAFVIGVPGSDFNDRDIYNVITRLARTLTYTLSRTPGQPVLDYCNFVFRSFGGNLALQAWFVVVSAAGVTALYCLVRELGGAHPFLAVLTLALNPFFLTHVGGVGDFAVSSSLLIISLLLASRGKALASGATLALAVGCRLVFCLYLIPVSVLLVLTMNARGAPFRQCLRAGATAVGVATLLSCVEYGPSFSFWGWNLLHNLPFQGMKYHTSVFLFRLIIGLGVPVVLIVGGVGISLIRRARKGCVLWTNPVAVVVAVLMILCCMLYLFRVPTKPDLTVPILIGIILAVQFCASRRWAAALLLGSVSVGLVVFSPYDRQRDRYGWHFEEGWYSQNYQEAYQNRFQLDTVRSLLATLPPKSLLIARQRWTIEQSDHADLESVPRLAGVDLGLAVAFRGLGTDRVIIDPADGNLRELLPRVTAEAAPGDRMTVFYEGSSLGVLRRWDHLDLAQYGRLAALR